jgi:hypothetical protein
MKTERFYVGETKYERALLALLGMSIVAAALFIMLLVQRNDFRKQLHSRVCAEEARVAKQAAVELSQWSEAKCRFIETPAPLRRDPVWLQVDMPEAVIEMPK